LGEKRTKLSSLDGGHATNVSALKREPEGGKEGRNYVQGVRKYVKESTKRIRETWQEQAEKRKRVGRSWTQSAGRGFSQLCRVPVPY